MNSQAVVRWPLLLPAREPHPGLENPRGAAELRLGEPESAHGEGGDLAVSLAVLQREAGHLTCRRVFLRAHLAAAGYRSVDWVICFL